MKTYLICLLCLFRIANLFAQTDQPMIGQQAPAFELKSLDGKTYSTEQFKGKFLVVHFAATWCPFCNAEAPNLEQLYKDYRANNVGVLMVDVKENKEVIAKALDKFNFTFPILLDEDGAVSAKYAPPGVLPDLARDEVPLASNLIIDKEGNIRFYSLLNTTNFDAKLSKLKQKLDELLAVK